MLFRCDIIDYYELLQKLERLNEYVSSQASDGRGEGFEQRLIQTPGSGIYVSFWNSGPGYFLKTEQEFISPDGPLRRNLRECTFRCSAL